MLAALPFLVYAAAANFGLSAGARLAAVAMSVAPHLMVPVAGFYGIMEAAGMVPFIFASFLSLTVVSLVHRFLLAGERGTGLALLVAAPLLYLSHLTAVFISAVPIAAIYLTRFRSTPLRRHAWLWLVLLAIVAVNWPWIEGYLLFSHYADLGAFYTPAGSEHFVPKGGLLAPFRVYVASPALLSLVPPVFAVLGLRTWWRERRSDLLAIFVPQIVFLFVISFYGALLGLNAVAPARITLPLGIYLFFPAAHAVAATLAKAGAWIRGRGVAAVAAASIALMMAALLAGLPAKIWRPYDLPKLQQREGFADRGMALIEWLGENTDGKGRILHEETNRKSHQYYGSHLPALIPYFTGREMAGGPAPHPLLQHNTLRFIAGTFRGEPIGRVASRTLWSDFSLYNVRWVLCWRGVTKHRFDRLSFADRVGEFDKFTLYRIDLPASWFLRGSGTLEVQDHRIVLRDVTAEDGIVAIKYHWLESLRSDPPRTIEPLQAPGDPVPFISVKDPPASLVIFNDFDHGLFGNGS